MRRQVMRRKMQHGAARRALERAPGAQIQCKLLAHDPCCSSRWGAQDKNGSPPGMRPGPALPEPALGPGLAPVPGCTPLDGADPALPAPAVPVPVPVGEAPAPGDAPAPLPAFVPSAAGVFVLALLRRPAFVEWRDGAISSASLSFQRKKWMARRASS